VTSSLLLLSVAAIAGRNLQRDGVHWLKRELVNREVSVRFNGRFACGPGLAGTRMSLFWISVGAKDDGSGEW